jgi:3-hydroxyacyl-[acyl-carrier-protein] dehydratase
VASKELIVDYSVLSSAPVIAGIEEIRRYNPQRFEMEHLSAIVFEDAVRHVVAGYRDVAEDEFWVRGHMPGMPLMPGVLICEASAQLCSYFVQKYGLMGDIILGFGGLDEVRFRDPVRPGDRLYIVAELIKLRRGAMVVSRFQALVGGSMVCEGILKGIPLPKDRLLPAPAAT